MSRKIMLISDNVNTNIRNISLGIMKIMKQEGLDVDIFNPVLQFTFDMHKSNKRNNFFNSNFNNIELITREYIDSIFCFDKKESFIEEIISFFQKDEKKHKTTIIEGILPVCKYSFIDSLNYEISNALNSDIIFIFSLYKEENLFLEEYIKLMYSDFYKNQNIFGIIINKLNVKLVNKKNVFYYERITNSKINAKNNNKLKILNKSNKFHVLGHIPYDTDLISNRVIDIAENINASILNSGEINIRRIRNFIFCNDKLINEIENIPSDSLIIVSYNHYDILTSILLSIRNKSKISAILITDFVSFKEKIHELFNTVIKTGLPILSISSNELQVLISLQNMSIEIPINDNFRIKRFQSYITNSINKDCIRSFVYEKQKYYLSPLYFIYQLKRLSSLSKKNIILPEGHDIRIINAASICAEKEIANCILIGDKEKIHNIALKENIFLNEKVKIINPKLIREKYIYRLMEIRKNKGITESYARKYLESNIVLGTMMLENGEVDGLVSGVVHTTADTIRPSLQIIKTKKNSKLISSIFFMLLPDKVLVYGDCAINVNPDAEQLSEIAIQSADSAKIFGIDPRIAMISYSTENSGYGSNVETVRKATSIVQKKRPDLLIDGPIQYDAAISNEVSLLKSPKSIISGKATVFIFPDLNTGNSTYKAVQYSSEAISIGPILQGIRKPVNDLSRGAKVDDIVYTIAVTSIQSQ